MQHGRSAAGRKGPELKLVGSEQATDDQGRAPALLSPLGRLEVVPVVRLSAEDQQRVKQLAELAGSDASVLGVALTAHSWDLRPLTVNSLRSDPQLLRVLPCELGLTAAQNAWIAELYDRVAAARSSYLIPLQAGHERGDFWCVRSLVDETVAERLLRNSLDVPFALSIARELLTALRELQERGIVHGHLSPTNIALPDAVSPTIRLLDPGLAVVTLQALGAGLRQGSYDEERLGSYIAPEILRGEAALVRSDLYSVGEIIRVLLPRPQVNTPLVKGRTLELLINQSAILSPREKKRFFQTAEELHQLLERMTVVEPLQRPTLEVIDAPLRALLDELERLYYGDGDDPLASGYDSALLRSNGNAEPHTAPLQFERGIPDTNSTSEQMVGAKNVLLSNGQEASRSTSTWVVALLAIAVTATAVLLLGPKITGTESHELMPRNKWKQAWQSGDVLQQQPVLRAAVTGDREAQAILLQSVIEHKDQPPRTEDIILRFALDPRWEGQLSERDRSAAFAFSYISLFRDTGLPELPRPEELHPGILLALATVGEPYKTVLRQAPAVLLTQLPVPLGQAFQLLLGDEVDLNCADDRVLMLASFAAKGVERTDKAVDFLQPDVNSRVRALALLYSQNNSQAKHVVDLLTNHPNSPVNGELVTWGKLARISEWKELESSEQLLLLGGFEPTKRVGATNMPLLFAHPVPVIRALGLREALDRISFAHPGAFRILSTLQKTPEALSALQTAQLAEFLEAPERIAAKKVMQFLATDPPDSAIAHLLVSAAKTNRGYAHDAFFVGFLQRRGWTAKEDVLKILAGHPIAVVRLFAYRLIADARGKEAEEKALKLLQGFQDKETDTAIKELLNSIIEGLELREAIPRVDY